MAEKLAEKLSYDCVDRDVLLAASKEVNIPEVRMVRTLIDSPSILDRFTYGKEKYTTFIKHTIKKREKKQCCVPWISWALFY